MNIDSTQVYVPKNADELRDNWLRDVRLEALALGLADPPVQPGTDLYIRATANANADLIQYANIAIADQSTDLLSANGDALEEKRKAYGLPEVKASPSTGNVTVSVVGGGTATLTPATLFVFPNGKRGKIASSVTISDGQTAPVVAIDTGSDTNLAVGGKIRFVAAPTNVKTEATVATGGLTGGLDDESDERKRSRILNELGHLRAGGNWSQKIEAALDALSGLQYAFVYPALGGPGSEKVAVMRDFDVANYDFSRVVTAADVAIVQGAMEDAFAQPFKMLVQSVANETTDVALTLSLPEFSSKGWVNRPSWPLLDGDTYVAVTGVTSTTVIQVGALTTTAPVDGVTKIAWWSSATMAFYERTVTAHSGSTGAWVLTLDAALTDANGNNVATGDFISPSAVNIGSYGDYWVTAMRANGPGENTTSTDRLPRAARKPTTSESYPSSLTIKQLDVITAAHTEIANADYSYRSKTDPTTPGLVATAPNVLIPRHFGVYRY